MKAQNGALFARVLGNPVSVLVSGFSGGLIGFDCSGMLHADSEEPCPLPRQTHPRTHVELFSALTCPKHKPAGLLNPAQNVST